MNRQNLGVFTSFKEHKFVVDQMIAIVMLHVRTQDLAHMSARATRVSLVMESHVKVSLMVENKLFIYVIITVFIVGLYTKANVQIAHLQEQEKCVDKTKKYLPRSTGCLKKNVLRFDL